MVLVDTSAWIELVRNTGSRTHRRLRWLAREPRALATSEVVVMELLGGARSETEFARLRQTLVGCRLLPLYGLEDFEDAASLYRTCRRAGTTIRSFIDCLIAVVAMRHNAEVLHIDRDFTLIARHVPLRIAEV